MTKARKLSFVIPAKNEEGSIEILYQEIISVVKNKKYNYEIVFIDDGSTDKTFENFTKLKKGDPCVKVIKLRGNWGKAVAMQAGFTHATGDLIFTLDADLQDNPKEIPKFIEKIDEGYDLVVGWKKERHDPLSKLISTRLFNGTVKLLTGLKIHDVNCGFKAYKKEVINDLPLYGDLFRLIPVIAQKQNYKVGEVIVEHRKRKHGKSKFGLERSYKGMLDLLTVVFLTGYLKRPGHFFGGLGFLSFFGGFLVGMYITFLRFTTGSIQYRQPLLFLGILLMVIGVQLVTTGLLAELTLHLNQKSSVANKTETIL
ncbi:glycosyltransferase family 2 protein [Candidatus Woesebacteria bacterium]|nr:MAG: glycosyltransferase family 2 protein [Candidatus Woesebacteria bacterium]